MHVLTIRSRRLDRTLEFRQRGGYIYLEDHDADGNPARGKDAQICHGGHYRGACVDNVGGDEASFERKVRAWYRAHLRAYHD